MSNTSFNENIVKMDIKKYPPKNWNFLLQDCPNVNYYQTEEHAKYRSKIFGDIPLFTRFYDNENKIIGQALLFQRRFALRKFKKIFGDGSIYSVFKKMSRPIKKFTWYHSLIIFDKTYSKKILNAFGNFFVSNNYSFDGFFNPISGLRFKDDFGFKEESYGTFIINLKDNLNEILQKSNKHSVQKNIIRSEKRGVTVKQIKTEKDVLSHYKLLKEHRLNNHLIPPSKNGTLEMYKIGKNVGVTGFLAINEDEPVGSITVVSFNGHIVEQGIARSKKDAENNLYSQDLLRLNIIKWGKENNCVDYDLAGVKLQNRTKKEDGIFRNKAKWGGQFITYTKYSK